ncbi:putative 3-demethylubiquinone-9 3-methyltransferase (glyoxalase superfamily) [Planomicrobium soli]|uniref:Putative 3-demethylubiquinone-9 3-methyltransferase (Glyoxalase superfamily) n=1 Tax=Planomicrobium soli TaxID=1176648 RepID=A0A2P8G9L6_9BACL|nr:VOC family protein [Planomicrobium soli]PSL30585.1 putative 3-demethylubiquinone-9 3-methyltransferase (glyoxalase superfamily) [Planomicrobium soli]
MESRIQKITPNFWFNMNAEEAVSFYTSIFKNSKIGQIVRYVNAGQEIHGIVAGTVMTIEFQLEGQEFLALNGGPEFQFTEALSLIINCENQEEVDYYWDKLTEGGDEKSQVCGWLKDKFGVSWQVTPIALNSMLTDSDTEKVERVMTALLQMKKLDLDVLQRAYEG